MTTLGSVWATLRRAPTRVRLLGPIRSFLWPIAAFRDRRTMERLVVAGDSGCLTPNPVAGKRVLCLVEAAANTHLVRKLFPAAASVDFILERTHDGIGKFVATQVDQRPACSVRFLENMLPSGGAVERDRADRNYAFVESFAGFFDVIFNSDERLRRYRAYSRALAGCIEPYTYMWCFVAPKAIETMLATGRPDVVILLCRAGTFFAPLLPSIVQAAGSLPVLVGYSHSLGEKRRELALRIADIAASDWAWREGPKAWRLAPEGEDRPGRGIAAALLQLEQATKVKLAQQLPNLPSKRTIGALTTLQADYIGYNYRFRRALLARLAENFDLSLFAFEADRGAEALLEAELQAAEKAHGGDARLVPFASAMTHIHRPLAELFDRHRALWQRRLIELAGGSWVVPIFELVLFGRMVQLVAARLEYANFLEARFRACPPAFALAITGETSAAEIFLTAARQNAIPTFDMQIVGMSEEPRNRVTLLPKADHFFAMDLQSAELLASWGWNPDTLYLNGTVRFDQLQALAVADHRERGRAKLADRNFRHLVLFISQALLYDYCKETLEAVARAVAQRPGCVLMVKLHPVEPVGNRHIYEVLLNELMPRGNWYVTSDMSIDDALCASDLVVGLYSLALIEAACLRKPVIAANLTGARFSEPTNLGDRACMLAADSEAKIAELIAAVLDDAAFRSAYRARQEEYFRQHAYMVDGGAMERIARTIAEVVERRPVSAQSLTAWRSAQRQSDTPLKMPS